MTAALQNAAAPRSSERRNDATQHKTVRKQPDWSRALLSCDVKGTFKIHIFLQFSAYYKQNLNLNINLYNLQYESRMLI